MSDQTGLEVGRWSHVVITVAWIARRRTRIMRVTIREDKIYSRLVIVDCLIKVMLLSISREDLVIWLAR